MLCLIKETSVVRSRHPGIHGCRCTIVSVPDHPNTWFQVQLHNPPNAQKKYESPIKVQATSLIPITEDGEPIPPEAGEVSTMSDLPLTSSLAPVSSPYSVKSASGSKSKKVKKSKESVSPPAIPAVSSTSAISAVSAASAASTASAITTISAAGGKSSEAGILLSKVVPVDHWIGRRVLFKLSRKADIEAIVVGSGNGWVQLVQVFPDGSPEGPDGEPPKEFAKRAHELKCKDAAPAAVDDPYFMGGKFAGTNKQKVAVIITSGRFKKRKGKIIGGGHGFYLVELRDKTVVLKTEDQFDTDGKVEAVVDAVIHDGAGKDEATFGGGEGGSGGEVEERQAASAYEKTNVSGSTFDAAAAVASTGFAEEAMDAAGATSVTASFAATAYPGAAVDNSEHAAAATPNSKRERAASKKKAFKSDKSEPSAALSRPRRANAGINKARTDPKHSLATGNKYGRRYGSAADGGDEESDSDNPRAGPMTPAERLAHRNKEKIKAKFRAVQNAVLKRSKRSTRGSRYSQVGV